MIGMTGGTTIKGDTTLAIMSLARAAMKRKRVDQGRA